MTINKEKEILDFLCELLTLDHLKDILQKVVSGAPPIVGCEGCSIYLIPELVKDSLHDLIDHSYTHLDRYIVGGPFIVLAAHSHVAQSDYKIGQHFYRSGEGLTGWVFKNQAPLLLDDLSDPAEIRRYPGLEWRNKYGHADKWYPMQDRSRPKPFIALPLTAGRRCVGVIRFMNTRDGDAFSALAQDTVRSFGSLISRRIETELGSQDKQRSIKNLITIGAMSNEPGVFKAIVEESQNTVGASACRLYTLDETSLDEIGEKVVLVEASDQALQPNLKRDFKRGEGYIGWIFKTGSALRVNEIHPRIDLDCFNVETYTGASGYFDAQGDQQQAAAPILLAPNELSPGNKRYARFLGVPVSKGKGRIHGVLVALSPNDSKPFNDDDLYLLNKLAQTVTLLLESLRQQKLNDMLIRMGHEYGDKLFQYVVERLPALVFAQGCSIFRKSDAGHEFILRYTSSTWLKEKDGGVKHICYAPGVGKTGFVAEYGRILMINHYGLGENEAEGIDRRRLEEDFDKYTGSAAYADINLVRRVTNDHDEPQGLARLIRDKLDPPFTDEEQKAFEDFIDQHPYVSKAGLACHEHHKLCEDGTDGGYSTSFLGMPFRDRQANVYGVIRIPKKSPGGDFTDQDLRLVVSVCNRLFSYIELEQNLVTLTGINTQINASFGEGNLDSILRSILAAVTDTLGFEFVTIQLVSPDKQTIRYVLGRKNPRIPDALDPEKWRDNVNYRLDADPPDIQAWLLREHRKPLIVKGWHKYFNKKIYEEHHHENLIRAFIPIINQNTDEIIGTIEAGHHVRRRDFIDAQEIHMLKALADTAAIALKNTQLHEELKHKVEQLQRVYKELATVSHELKAPLAFIKRHFDNARSGVYGEMTSKHRQSTVDAFRNMNEEIRLIDNILDLASIQENRVSLEFESFDLREVIDDVVKLLELEAVKKNGEIAANYDQQILKVRADKQKIRRVIVNLVHNAIKHSPAGCRVGIAGSIHDQYVTVSITDNGPGIAKDQHERIFQRFYRIDHEAKGMGIGLEIARELVEMHHGVIKVSSSPGEGSRFSFTLPLQGKE